MPLGVLSFTPLLGQTCLVRAADCTALPTVPQCGTTHGATIPVRFIFFSENDELDTVHFLSGNSDKDSNLFSPF